jgi:hypothetical protein
MLGRIVLPVVRKSLSYNGKINVLTLGLFAKEVVCSLMTNFTKFFPDAYCI